MRRLACAAATAGLAITTLGISPAVAAPPAGPADASRLAPVPVARNLDNPRQLDLTDDGVLVIAESGTGGRNCAGEGEDAVCVGTTGAVSIVRRPSKAQGVTAERVVTGLLSEAGPSGFGATGNDGASARSLDEIFVAKDVDVPDGISGLPEEQEGKLLRAAAGEPAAVVADVRAFEAANDPDRQGIESNPYAVLDLGDRVLVADAAGNDILAVDERGEISVFAVLPTISGGACDSRQNQGGRFCDPVPTSLTFSRDGDVIVAGLGSLVPGAGRVWELDRRTGAIQQTWTGFTGVTGAAQDQAGNLYVSELFGGADGAGQVVFVPKNGARATLPVPRPAGVVVDQPGNVYVAVNSMSPGTGAPGSDGQVWRLTKRSF
ncbi:ScyD/ScyE family protein [Blastococcus sp. BMG 814]|uniref:ScyD/ScyE family protein n=1 Tax=Blastococcus carthaginiensis TaxID=3050034 RepID=A0ABT9IAG8_9ACTN|nr:ScyD/ScyE family protein [Blastococcus carthaginiensis]MDP5182568.1 ScyD/ScyE family protein [Blastococcus carthaginiensis]